MSILLAVIIGAFFGFVLHRVGATNPQIIINMLRLRDFHLMKVILFAIGISSALLFAGMSIGLVSPENLSVKSSYWGVLIGGIIFASVGHWRVIVPALAWQPWVKAEKMRPFLSLEG